MADKERKRMSALRTSTAVPTVEMLELNAGDLLEWTRDLGGDFLASAWTVTYYLVGPAKYTIPTAGSGTTFSVSVTPANTAAWLPGEYALRGFATKTNNSRIQIYDGKLTILEDPSQMADGTDTRSHAKKMLDAIEEVMRTRASRPEKERDLQGMAQSYIYKTDEELRNEWAFWKEEYNRELEADGLLRGESPVHKIAVRFR